MVYQSQNVYISKRIKTMYTLVKYKELERDGIKDAILWRSTFNVLNSQIK